MSENYEDNARRADIAKVIKYIKDWYIEDVKKLQIEIENIYLKDLKTINRED